MGDIRVGDIPRGDSVATSGNSTGRWSGGKWQVPVHIHDMDFGSHHTRSRELTHLAAKLSQPDTGEWKWPVQICGMIKCLSFA